MLFSHIGTFQSYLIEPCYSGCTTQKSWLPFLFAYFEVSEDITNIPCYKKKKKKKLTKANISH